MDTSDVDSEMSSTSSSSETTLEESHPTTSVGHKRRASCETYLHGRSHRPYRLRKRLEEAVKEVDMTACMEGVCDECVPALAKIVEGFID